jgi:hypothetical protein
MTDVSIDRRIKALGVVRAGDGHFCRRHEVRVVMNDMVNRFAPLFEALVHGCTLYPFSALCEGKPI